jgi:hypothetical protein
MFDGKPISDGGNISCKKQQFDSACGDRDFQSRTNKLFLTTTMDEVIFLFRESNCESMSIVSGHRIIAKDRKSLE